MTEHIELSIIKLNSNSRPWIVKLKASQEVEF